jgi:hypothetical protein
VTGTIGTPVGASLVVNPGDHLCYRYNNADGPHFTTKFVVTTMAEIVFDPQLDAAVTVATAAILVPRICPTGAPVEPGNPERSCISKGGANANPALDGVEGPGVLQNASILLGPGVWILEIPAGGACLAGDTCQAAITGEEK